MIGLFQDLLQLLRAVLLPRTEVVAILRRAVQDGFSTNQLVNAEIVHCYVLHDSINKKIRSIEWCEHVMVRSLSAGGS